MDRQKIKLSVLNRKKKKKKIFIQQSKNPRFVIYMDLFEKGGERLKSRPLRNK